MTAGPRTGQRKKREAFRARREPLLGYYLVCTNTGKTEANYLKGLHASLPDARRGRVTIKVHKAKRLDELIGKAKREASLAPNDASLWLVFDRDEETAFDETIKAAESEGISVGWSNPCIEAWFLMYFGQTGGFLDSKACCRRFGTVFRERAGREYDKADEGIYQALERFGDEEKAIKTAKAKHQAYARQGKKPSEMAAASTLYRLVGEIKGSAAP